MSVARKLSMSNTYRMAGAGIFNGVSVGSIDDTDDHARISIDIYHAHGSGRTTCKLDPAGLRALAVALIAAADFIDECATERAVNDLTNTDAQ